MEKVKFVSAKPYMSVPISELHNVYFCLKGRQEVVVECSESLKEELRALPSEYYIPRMREVIKYLEATGVPYEIGDLKNTTTV